MSAAALQFKGDSSIDTQYLAFHVCPCSVVDHLFIILHIRTGLDITSHTMKLYTGRLYTGNFTHHERRGDYV